MAGIGGVRCDDEVPEPVFVEDELVESKVFVIRIRRSLRQEEALLRVDILRISCRGGTSWLAQSDGWRIRYKCHLTVRSSIEPTVTIMTDDGKSDLRIPPLDEVCRSVA